jgi:folate-binding protein YgfZ
MPKNHVQECMRVAPSCPLCSVEMTVVEAPIDAYRALTEGCGLLDRAERGKLALVGPAAKEFLGGQVTNDVEALTPGTGCYAAFLTNKGKMLGDLRVLDLGGELFVDTERPTLQLLFNLIRRGLIGWDAELEKRTVERGLLSLIGPAAGDVAGASFGAEHANGPVSIGGVAAVAVTTDLGVDLLCDAADTPVLAAALREAGAVPVEEPAAEIVRVEHGRPRYGIDLDDTVIPQEAGLNDRAVSFTKGCYIGQETVARLHWRGKPNRHLRGLLLSTPVASGAELRLGERVVGAVGTSVVSPRLGPIALALVRREAGPGDVLDAAGTRAAVVELPF